MKTKEHPTRAAPSGVAKKTFANLIVNKGERWKMLQRKNCRTVFDLEILRKVTSLIFATGASRSYQASRQPAKAIAWVIRVWLIQLKINREIFWKL